MLSRILFVEDEELLREFYGTIGSALGEGHEVFTAAGGKEALDLARTTPFDVIVSDLAMPKMDGVEFFREVVRFRPDAARIVVSGCADRMKVAECLAVGHRFFNKPLNFKTLADLLKRICEYNYLIRSERVRSIVCGSKALPTPPDTYLRLTELLNSEYAEVEEVAAIVQQDPGMTTKLLHLVNSAQFGFGRTILEPAEAVSLLGLDVIQALIAGSHIFNFFSENRFVQQTLHDLWMHSLDTAVAARKIAHLERRPSEECEECFLAGLLHDVGKLILAANAESEYRMILDLAQKKQMPLSQAETGILDTTHAQIGAYLLALWGIPQRVVHTVEFHHTLESPDASKFGPLLAVHAAQNLSSRRQHLLNTDALEQAGLLDRVPDWRAELLDSGLCK